MPLYDTGSSEIYDIKKKKEQLQSFYGIKWKLKGPFEVIGIERA